MKRNIAMKQCKEEGCNNPVFSNHLCKFHQYLNPKVIDRENKKKLEKAVSTSIYNDKKKYIKPKSKVTGELELFKKIWNEREHISQISGDKIFAFDPKCFHHILTKQAFPEHRLNKDNIVLITKQEHMKIHSMALSDLIHKDNRYQIIKDIDTKIRYGEK